MKKPTMAKLILRGNDFVHIASNGVETIVYTAANAEAAEAISRMLDNVTGGGYVNGRYVGYKLGFKRGLIVAGVAGVIAGYIAIKVWMTEQKFKKDEADAE